MKGRKAAGLAAVLSSASLISSAYGFEEKGERFMLEYRVGLGGETSYQRIGFSFAQGNKVADLPLYASSTERSSVNKEYMLAGLILGYTIYSGWHHEDE